MFKQKLNLFLASLLILAPICLVLNALPLGLALSPKLLRLAILTFLLLFVPFNWTTLVNFQRKVLPPGSKKQKSFIYLSIANLVLVTFCVMGFALFQHGSPLVYEEPIKSFKKAHEKWIVNQNTVTQQFQASSDNLGTITVKLAVKQKTVTVEDGLLKEVIRNDLTSDLDLTLNDLTWLEHYQDNWLSFYYPSQGTVTTLSKPNELPIVQVTFANNNDAQQDFAININPEFDLDSAQQVAEQVFLDASKAFPEKIQEPKQFQGLFEDGWRLQKLVADDLGHQAMIDTAFFEIDNQVFRVELSTSDEGYEQAKDEFELILASFETADHAISRLEQELLAESDELPTDDLLLDDDLEPVQLLVVEPVEVGFKIKELGADEWLAENRYYFDQTLPLHLYPFGFPVQTDSEGKTYVFEITPVMPEWVLEMGEDEAEADSQLQENMMADDKSTVDDRLTLQTLGVFVETDNKEELNYATRFVFRRDEMMENKDQIVKNFGRRFWSVVSETRYLINIVTVFVLLELVVFSVLSKEEERFERVMVPVLSYVFLFFLTLVSIASLEFEFIQHSVFWELIIGLKKYNWPLVASTIIIGGLLLLLKKKEIEFEAEVEEKEEKIIDKHRQDYFDQKYPRLSKIWLVRSLTRWLYIEGWVNLLILLGILTMFTVVKAPYFGLSFTGDHTMKYNSYVEPAKYMYERNNPFWMQKKYQADPVTNPQGIFKLFGSPPIMEWGLLATYYIFPNNSLEYNTRLFTHFLGIVVLLLAYGFFKKWMPRKTALFLCFFMAINPIINFMTFVTVLDSWAMIFTFASLICLSNYIQTQKPSNLFFSGLLFGVGSVVKYSMFLWLFPISLLLMTYNFKKPSAIIKNLCITGFLTLLVFATQFTAIRYFPSDLTSSLVKFFFWMVILLGFFLILKRFDKKIQDFFQKLLERKILLFSSIVVSIILAVLFLKFFQISSLSNEFLADSSLIFNLKMYKHMLQTQFKPYMTPNMYYLGVIGFIISFFVLKIQTQKNILISFFTGATLYWIMASKVMFFHNYYTGIIMILFAISGSLLINNLKFYFKNKILEYLLSSLILLFVLSPSIQANTLRVSRENHIGHLKEVAQFLTQNSEENEIYIDAEYNQYLTILTNRPQTTVSKLNKKEIRDSIQEIGFKDTMKKFKISYLITTKEEPDYLRFVNLFTDQELEPTSYRRSDLILSRLDPSYEYFPDISYRNKIVEEKNIKEKFVLKKQVGPYKIFSFKD